ncbi:MAG: hypothetical protein NZ693_05040 [Thermoflexales bacterium]|nr:hypothetical protein [Thermoflexales bacterium]
MAINRIALIDPNGELETIAPDGSARRSLTHGEYFYQFPAWSPDGKRIAAVGGTAEQVGVFTFEDTEQASQRRWAAPRALFESQNESPIYLFWSPNSKHLSFIAALLDRQPPQLALRVIAADADPEIAARARPIALGRPCFWDWSADSKAILLHTGTSEDSAHVRLIDPFNPSRGKVSLSMQPGFFRAPGISRTGRYLAFGEVSRNGNARLTVDDRQVNRRIAIEHHGFAALGWSPTDDRLAFICPTEPINTYYGPLRVVDVTEGRAQVITEDTVLAFFWSPMGDRIAYFTVAEHAIQFNALLAQLDPAEAARVGGSARPDVSEDDSEDASTPSFMPLNLWIADLKRSETRLVCTFEPVETFLSLFLPFFDQYALSHRLWSPDGSALVLPMMRREGGGEEARPFICVVPADRRAGAPLPIAEGIMAFWSWQ